MNNKGFFACPFDIIGGFSIFTEKNHAMAEDIKDKDLTREDILRYREDLVEHARRLFLDSDEKQVRVLRDLFTEEELTGRGDGSFATRTVRLLNLAARHEPECREEADQCIAWLEGRGSTSAADERIAGILARPISEAGFSKRAVNILSTNGIRRLADLAKRPEPDVLRLRGMGGHTFYHVLEVLQGLGLKMGMDVTKYGFDGRI